MLSAKQPRYGAPQDNDSPYILQGFAAPEIMGPRATCNAPAANDADRTSDRNGDDL